MNVLMTINYLPKDKREELSRLRSLLNSVETDKERNRILERIKIIEDAAKPINECNPKELMDFKRQLYDLKAYDRTSSKFRNDVINDINNVIAERIRELDLKKDTRDNDEGAVANFTKEKKKKDNPFF